MQYLDPEGKVVYTAKDSRISKSFPALEWMAHLCSNILNSCGQMVQYKDSATLSETALLP
jgi:hypothetical protein